MKYSNLLIIKSISQLALLMKIQIKEVTQIYRLCCIIIVYILLSLVWYKNWNNGRRGMGGKGESKRQLKFNV